MFKGTLGYSQNLQQHDYLSKHSQKPKQYKSSSTLKRSCSVQLLDRLDAYAKNSNQLNKFPNNSNDSTFIQNYNKIPFFELLDNKNRVHSNEENSVHAQYRGSNELNNKSLKNEENQQQRNQKSSIQSQKYSNIDTFNYNFQNIENDILDMGISGNNNKRTSRSSTKPNESITKIPTFKQNYQLKVSHKDSHKDLHKDYRSGMFKTLETRYNTKKNKNEVINLEDPKKEQTQEVNHQKIEKNLQQNNSNWDSEESKKARQKRLNAAKKTATNNIIQQEQKEIVIRIMNFMELYQQTDQDPSRYLELVQNCIQNNPLCRNMKFPQFARRQIPLLQRSQENGIVEGPMQPTQVVQQSEQDKPELVDNLPIQRPKVVKTSKKWQHLNIFIVPRRKVIYKKMIRINK